MRVDTSEALEGGLSRVRDTTTENTSKVYIFTYVNSSMHILYIFINIYTCMKTYMIIYTHVHTYIYRNLMLQKSSLSNYIQIHKYIYIHVQESNAQQPFKLDDLEGYNKMMSPLGLYRRKYVNLDSNGFICKESGLSLPDIMSGSMSVYMYVCIYIYVYVYVCGYLCVYV
jgi:hypothetical protein